MGIALGIGLGVTFGDLPGDAAPPATPVDAMSFAGSQSYFGTGACGGAVSTVRARFRVTSMPGTALQVVAGTNPGNGTSGWLIALQDSYGGPSAVGQLVVYIGNGALRRVGRKFLMPTDIGRVLTVHIVANGTDIRAYLDGHLMDLPLTTFGTIPTSAYAMWIGGSNVGGASASALDFIDAAQGSTALSAVDIATDAASSVPAFVDQNHRWVAASGITTTWADQVGSYNLARFGAPAPTAFVPTYSNHRGVIEIWGDSIAAGTEVGPLLGNGWRREVQRLCSTYGKAITFKGRTVTTSGTKDYDWWHSATSGEALNTRLPTLASNLADSFSANNDAATLLAYGANDYVVLGRTAAQIQSDVTSACGIINTARPGRPIFICSLLPRDLNTGPQEAERLAYNNGLASLIATLQATYPAVRGIDYSGVVTNAADPAQLYDGGHPSPATYSLMANVMAPIIAAAM